MRLFQHILKLKHRCVFLWNAGISFGVSLFSLINLKIIQLFIIDLTFQSPQMVQENYFVPEKFVFQNGKATVKLDKNIWII